MDAKAYAVPLEEDQEDSPRIRLECLEGVAVDVLPESQATEPVTDEQEPILLEEADEVPSPEAPVKKTGKCGEFVYGDSFIVDTMDIPNAKIIPEVIRSVALELFPDSNRYRSNDYYYAYNYDGAKLVFVIVKTKAYVSGKLPGFLPAMLTPGRYCYRHGSQYYVIEHELEGHVSTKVYQEPQEDCIALEEAADELEEQKYAATLHLQWSLSRSYKPVTMVMLAVFLCTLGIYFASVQGYQDVTVRASQTAQQVQAPQPVGLPPVGELMNVVAGSTAEKGAIIKQIKKVDKTTLAFAVEFQNENDTREFITRKGGKYEDGKVVFAFDLAGAGHLGTGN